jgi:cytochrome c-type biogenesis protein CcmH
MTVFYIAAALLIVAALLFIVPPLLRREQQEAVVDRRSLNISIYQDQFAELERDLANDVITREQFEQGKLELERRLLDDVSDLDEAVPVPGKKPAMSRATVVSAVIIAGLVPLLATGVYMQTGTPQAITGNIASIATPGDHDLEHQIDQMIARLEQRLNDFPGDVDGWAMLGRSYLALERFDRALPALDRAVALGGNDPQLLVDFADVLAMTTNNMSLEGRPMELIEQALAIDPTNQKGLWLAGTAEYERMNFEGALVYWRRLQALVPPGSDAARAMQGNIAEIESLIRESGATPAPAPPVAAAEAGRTVSGTIGIDDALRDRVDPADTVFIFARAAQGPRMPLAVLRAEVRDLPLDYTLDDSMAMDPSLSLSRFQEVVVVARVSRSGSAMAESGDLQGSSGVVRTGGDESARVVINEVIP